MNFDEIVAHRKAVTEVARTVIDTRWSVETGRWDCLALNQTSAWAADANNCPKLPLAVLRVRYACIIKRRVDERG